MSCIKFEGKLSINYVSVIIIRYDLMVEQAPRNFLNICRYNRCLEKKTKPVPYHSLYVFEFINMRSRLYGLL